jgi:hypothetical protein
MKLPAGVLAACLLVATPSAATAQTSPALPCVVDLKASDGTPLKDTHFAAAKSGPGVLLLHQSNRDRKSWDGVAAQVASAGINAVTVDMHGLGESGGTRADFKRMPEDVQTTHGHRALSPLLCYLLAFLLAQVPLAAPREWTPSLPFEKNRTSLSRKSVGPQAGMPAKPPTKNRQVYDRLFNDRKSLLDLYTDIISR